MCYLNKYKIKSANLEDSEVSAGNVIGSIYSTACCDGGKGGIITRLAIADVTGHGEAVSEISQYVFDTLKAHI